LNLYSPPTAAALRPTPATLAAAPGSKDDDANVTLDVDAMAVAHAASEAHAPV
jgi:hypothetical protein